MQAFEPAVYLLCFLTSPVAMLLLLRSYRQNRTRLLLWSALGFIALAVNNFLLFADLVLLPTVNLLGVVVAFLIGGTVVIENVFTIPGLGALLVRAVLTRDYFVVQAVTLILACGVVIANFAVDVVTVMLDPRVKL